MTADILPPRLYLIEARLVASQALEGYVDAATARREPARLQSEYQARASHWAAGEVDRRAREVASGSADVGRRTERQASSLEETAALMEQAGAAAGALMSQAAMLTDSVRRYRARDARGEEAAAA